MRPSTPSASIWTGQRSIPSSTARRAASIALAFSLALAGAPPVVTKVEPPNWWAGHSINPVRVLIRGRHLRGARVHSALQAGRVSANANGTYLFVDVHIPGGVRAGAYPLTISTGDGSVRAEFAVIPRLDPGGRFQGFGLDDVMYLIMPDRFANGDSGNDRPAKSPDLLDRTNPRFYHGGDLKGVIDKLPYLRDLGITAIWLNPVYDNNDRVIEGRQPFTDYHGYGATDFYAVDEHLGDIPTFRELADKAHAAGIKVIQDQVANHCGPFHPWVSDPPTASWFHGTPASHLVNRFQTWAVMDPHASSQVRRETLEGWFINLLPDLNQEDDEVRRYLIQNTLWWIGITGIDGIRQDTLPYVDRSFWADWAAAIKREYPRFRIVGEVLEDNPALVSFFQGGHASLGVDTRIDTVFDFPLYFSVRRTFGQNGSIRDLARTLSHDWLYLDSRVLVTHLGLHDVPRFMHEKGATTETLRLAFTFLMTTRGIPLIYYGDEIAMRGGPDPDNRRDFPGGWPGDARNAFTQAGRTREEDDVWQHVRKLARLRADAAALRRGKLMNLVTGEQQYVYRRGDVIVALNNDRKPATMTFEAPGVVDAADRLGSKASLRVRDGRATVDLGASAGAVFVPNNVR